jgi:hypothetical protein
MPHCPEEEGGHCPVRPSVWLIYLERISMPEIRINLGDYFKKEKLVMMWS